MLITDWPAMIIWIVLMAFLFATWYILWNMIKQDDKEEKYGNSFWHFFLFGCNAFSRVCNWIVMVCFVYNICRIVYSIIYMIRG